MYFTVASTLRILLLANIGGCSILATANSIYDLASATPSLSLLKGAIDGAGLADALSGNGTFTVFAPTNDAIAKVDNATLARLTNADWSHHLEDFLLYHVLPSVVLSTELVDGPVETLNGESIVVNVADLTINNSSSIVVDGIDITATNGVVHLIDTVLLPTSVTSNIVEIASTTADLSTLVDLVVKADLAEALSGTGPFTVFAPKNSAFAALPAAEVEDLIKPEHKGKLADLLQYHVVSGVYYLEDFMGKSHDHLETLNGEEIHIDVAAHDHRKLAGHGDDHEDEVTVNGAHIVATVYANNGVVHVLDEVLEDDHSHTSGSSMKMYFMGAAAALVSASILL